MKASCVGDRDRNQAEASSSQPGEMKGRGEETGLNGNTPPDSTSTQTSKKSGGSVTVPSLGTACTEGKASQTLNMSVKEPLDPARKRSHTPVWHSAT